MRDRRGTRSTATTRMVPIASAMLVASLLGSLPGVDGRGTGTPVVGVRPGSIFVQELPAPHGSPLAASIPHLALPLTDGGSDGGSGSRLSVDGSRLDARAGGRPVSGTAGVTPTVRSVHGHATSVGGRLLGLSGHPANAPPAP